MGLTVAPAATKASIIFDDALPYPVFLSFVIK
jgi:hypothetical protein